MKRCNCFCIISVVLRRSVAGGEQKNLKQNKINNRPELSCSTDFYFGIFPDLRCALFKLILFYLGIQWFSNSCRLAVKTHLFLK